MTRLRSIIPGIALLVASTSLALAQQSSGNANQPPAYYYPPHMWGWGGWHGGMFFGPLLWIIVIFGLVALFTRFGLWSHRGYHRRPGGALDILEERFARGEIDKAEFEEKRKALGR